MTQKKSSRSGKKTSKRWTRFRTNDKRGIIRYYTFKRNYRHPITNSITIFSGPIYISSINGNRIQPIYTKEKFKAIAYYEFTKSEQAGYFKVGVPSVRILSPLACSGTISNALEIFANRGTTLQEFNHVIYDHIVGLLGNLQWVRYPKYGRNSRKPKPKIHFHIRGSGIGSGPKSFNTAGTPDRRKLLKLIRKKIKKPGIKSQ